MPRRTDLKKILLIGSGPIVIGQAAEFDYSGTQALKALREEGYSVVLVNSNPATIMTDPQLSDRTYIEPLTAEVVEQVIARERPDALLPTLGGQTALNLAVALHDSGVLEKYGCRLIGAQVDAIKKAEDRQLFKQAMLKIGLDVPRSGIAHHVADALRLGADLGFPLILRPSFTLGGLGGGVVYNHEELEEKAKWGLAQSPVHEVLIEESLLGWKEFELEVIRDKNDNCIVVCSIENLDPMGVHTGDSITVAPVQTLTDEEYQRMRDAAFAIMREIGVETGGSNVQFAVDPKTGRQTVIEMNPRVSRSSALASKATGFPIAKIAAKLAVGYSLDELTNDITKTTPCSFEPAIDYVVVKIPRFTFEKFPRSDDTLGTAMKAVGEVMALGRTFAEALQKACRSLETGATGLNSPLGKDLRYAEQLPLLGTSAGRYADAELARIRSEIRRGSPSRLFWVAEAFRAGLALDEVNAASCIDPWFLREIEALVHAEGEIERGALHVSEVKRLGFSDARIAQLQRRSVAEVAAEHAPPVFKRVDTCAAEFDSSTPYLYSTYDHEDEVRPDSRRKVLILGSGPNRIGQGVEFDYCCVHAAYALRDAGVETIMLNCNPETVSTDYDTSDRLYFEPITLEDVLAVARAEKPEGVVVQFGGQTPLKLAEGLEAAGVKILGTSVDAIDIAEDRERFAELVQSLGLRQPENGIARSADEAIAVAGRIGYPVMVRPSFVLGGRAMEVVYGDDDLRRYATEAVRASPERPILIDRFLKDAIEVDVDLVSDGKDVVVAGVMEHVEEAGVHSGDSCCALPPFSLSPAIEAQIRDWSEKLARALHVVGLMNIQFAIEEGSLYILEANPRASRTVPFVSKATGVPLAKVAALTLIGKSLKEQGITERPRPKHVAVKEAVFPFARFSDADTILGPEMRSTGEVMGIGPDFPTAFLKSQQAAGNGLPREGTIFISVRDADKPAAADVSARFAKLGFKIVATGGTARYLRERGVPAADVLKVHEGRPHVVDRIIDGEINFVINTTTGKKEIADSYSIRRETLLHGIPYFTTMSAARASVSALEAASKGKPDVRSLQEYLAET